MKYFLNSMICRPITTTLVLLSLFVTGLLSHPLLLAERRATSYVEYCSLNATDPIACYANELRKETARKGYTHGFLLLSILERYDPRVVRDCHFLAHGIGHGTYERNPGGWGEAFRAIPSTCSNGAAHGMFERADDDGRVGKLDANTIRSMCGASEYNDCAHIAGHYVLIENIGNVRAAIATCQLLDGRMERRCYQGVFMENVLPIAEHFVDSPERRRELRAKEYSLIELCRTVDGRAQAACWQTIPLAFSRTTSLPETLAVCEQAPDDRSRLLCKNYTAFLYTLGGRETLESSYATLCTEKITGRDPGFAFLCPSIVAASSAERYPGETPAVIEFCSKLDGPIDRTMCFAGIGRAIQTMNEYDRKASVRACAGAPRALQTTCAGLNPWAGGTDARLSHFPL